MSYSLTLLSVKETRNMLSNRFFEISNRYNIPLSAKESMEDWIIVNATDIVLRTMYRVSVREFYRHDVYKAVYSDIFSGYNSCLGYFVELAMRAKILDSQLQFPVPESVKISIFDDVVILGRNQCNI